MPTYTETDFEDHIEQPLNQSDYRSLQSSHYDKSLCLIRSETLRFIQMTQLQAYPDLLPSVKWHEPRPPTALRSEPNLIKQPIFQSPPFHQTTFVQNALKKVEKYLHSITF